MRPLIICTLLFTTFTFAGTALAWGPQGHRIVGHIAEKHLTDKAKAAVRALLGPDGRLSNDDVAVWADHVRPQRKETVPWHYVDIPLEADRMDPARDCKDGECVIGRIEKFRRVIADKNVKQEERAEALKFLVHLVGDMHQPLHCAEREHDHGGGRLKVTYEGKPTNLHRIWDDHLVPKLMSNIEDIAGAGDKLDAQITPDLAAAWKKGTVEDWAMESHKLAQTHAYPGVPIQEPPAAIEPAYIARNVPVVKQRLQQAGVRLAALLNEAFQ